MSAYPMDKKPFAWVVLPLHYTLKSIKRHSLAPSRRCIVRDRQALVWVGAILAWFDPSFKNYGQSGERSQRAVKRQIYSLNRLLNGIPTHILRYTYNGGVPSLTKRSFDLRYIGVKLVAEVGFEPTCLTL